MEIDTSRLHGSRTDESAAVAAVQEPPRKLPVSLTADQVESLRQAVVDELHKCFDPEIPVNIYELGLIYGIDIDPGGAVHVRMTLTSPACPVAGSLPGEVRARLEKLANVTAAKVEVVWDPPWEKDRMSEAAKLQLGIDD